MDPHVQPFIQMHDQLHDDIYAAIAPLSDREVNWAHPSLSNTIGILLRHAAGSERMWILQVVGGQTIQRDRKAEFGREALSKDALVAELRRAQAETRAVLERLTAADLTRTVEVKWRGTPQTFQVAWAVLHALEHTSYHLGQIQLFKKMAQSDA